MAEWLGQTNQKLYQARLLIDAYDEQVDGSVLKDALYEGILFQLSLAYNAYLHELAAAVQCHEAFDSLTQLLSVTRLATGEMKELALLQQDSFSWLSQLFNAIESCGQLDKSARLTPASESMQRIDLVSESVNHGVRVWYDSLSGLIDLQRANRQES